MVHLTVRSNACPDHFGIRPPAIPTHFGLSSPIPGRKKTNLKMREFENLKIEERRMWK